ncbi:hypothetical protein ALC56_05322 [Trachymyrmex septentrionalis]|uniref:Uncharacterized protein n=1 Tax=Trachymyrmex septentrionalis TaxID=34720 RepID=A0A195FJE1_9HYME|nr:hypothetical protein ALC56_05322 [Trachymyrmex septentrionalis]
MLNRLERLPRATNRNATKDDRKISGRATSSYESSKTIWIERGERATLAI